MNGRFYISEDKISELEGIGIDNPKWNTEREKVEEKIINLWVNFK